MHTDAYLLETPRVEEALLGLEAEFTNELVSKPLLTEATRKGRVRIAKRSMAYNNTVGPIARALHGSTRFCIVDCIDPRSRIEAFNTC